MTVEKSLDFAGADYTIAAWFQAADTSVPQDLLAATNPTGDSHGILLEIGSDGKLRYLHRSPTGSSGGNDVYSSAAYDDGIWHHLAAMKQGSQMALYVDGVIVAEGSDGSVFTHPLDVILGRVSKTGDSRYFNGLLDEVRSLASINPDDVILHGAVSDAPDLDGARLALHLEEGAGATTFDDSSDYGNHGTCSGDACPAAGRDGVYGRGLSFDRDDIVTIQQGSGFANRLPERDFTVAAWVYLDSYQGWDGYVSAVQDNGGFEKGWVLGNHSDRFFLALSTTGADDGDGVLTYLEAEGTFTYGKWYHVAGIYDGETMQLYVDGAFQNSSTDQSGDVNYPSSGWFVVGSYKDDDEDYRHDGLLDEAYVFDRALSEAEIRGLAQAQIGGLDRLEIAFTPNAGGSPFYNESLPDGTVLYLPMDSSNVSDENHVVRFADFSGNNHAVTCTGNGCPATGAEGRRGRALQFDGVDDKLSIHMYPPNAPAGSYTLAAWIKFSGSKWTGYHTVMEFGNDAPWFGVNNGRLEMYGVIAGGQAPIGEWTHVAYTWDGTNSRLCINGAEVASNTQSYWGGGSGLGIGRNSGDVPWQGLIDEVYVLDRALSPDEIQALYYGAGPRLHLTFDDDLLTDDSGMENHGLLYANDAADHNAPGKVGAGALQFDGDDHVDCGDDASLATTRTTVCLWAKPSSGNAAWTRIAQRGNADGKGWALRIGEDGNRFIWQHKLASASDNVQSGVFVDGAWHHLCGVFDGFSQSLYVNGEAAAGSVADAAGSTGTSVTIAKRAGEDMQYFDGALDDVRVYARALSALEIKELYDSGWREITPTQTGENVAWADWSAAIPDGLEGFYQVDLRGHDTLGNRNDDPASRNLWRGPIDTLAPREIRFGIFQREAGEDNYGTDYRCSATDFSLNEAAFRCGPCAEQAGEFYEAERVYYNAPWYRALSGATGKDSSKLYHLEVRCAFSSLPTAAPTFIACDTDENCVTLTRPAMIGIYTPDIDDGFEDVYVSGDYAYLVGYGDSGFRVVDVSTPTSPTLEGFVSGPETDGEVIYVEGDYAYLGRQSEFKVVDVSPPSTPTRVGFRDIGGGRIWSIHVAGNYAYLAAEDRVQIVNVSTPNDPTLAGSYVLPEMQATDIHVSGNYAYVADRDAGLRVINISNPDNPTPAGDLAFDPQGEKATIAVDGSYAYMMGPEDRLWVIDVSTPGDPTQAGLSAGENWAMGHVFHVAGDYAYILDEPNFRLSVFDVSNPSDPQLVMRDWRLTDRHSDQSSAHGVGNIAYVADRRVGLSVVDFGDPGTIPAMETSAGLEQSARSTGRSFAPTASSAAALEATIFTPFDGSILTSTAPISVAGRASALTPLETLTVTLDGAPIYVTQTAAVTETLWSTSWTPAGEGAHRIAVETRDQAGTVMTETEAITVTLDTQPPSISIGSTVVTSTHYDAMGQIALTGLASDTVAVVGVEFQVSGGDPDIWQTASLDGETWNGLWYLGSENPPDGAVYTVTARAIDLAGRTVQVTQAITVDVVGPVLGLNLTPYAIGNVITDTDVVHPFICIGPASDGSGVEGYRWGWTSVPTYTVAELNYNAYSAISQCYVTNIEVEGDGGRHYYHLIARDVYGNQTTMPTVGPIYHDMPTTPDYISMEENDGPFEGHPYRLWMDSGCSHLGTDARIPNLARPGAALNQAQKLYTTWDRNAIRLTWTGANWNTDGDLFIYLDSIADQAAEWDGTPHVRYGGNLAYNPYSSTISSTVILLPTDKLSQVEVEGLPPGTPEFTAFNADYALWVQDDRTVTWLRWDNTLGDWVDEGSAADQGVLYVFEQDETMAYTDLYVPFDLIGVTYPSQTVLPLVALVTEQDALRIWSAIPPRNPVNSARVVLNAPPTAVPHRMVLSDFFFLPLIDDYCGIPWPDGRVPLQLTSTEPGFGYSSSDDAVRLIVPQPAWFDGIHDDADQDWLHGAAYRDWLADEYCPTDLTHVECRPDKPPAQPSIQQILGALMDVSHPPLQPGQTATWTLEYINKETFTHTLVVYVYTGDDPFNDVGGILWSEEIEWYNDCPGWLHVDVSPDDSVVSVELPGVIAPQGVEMVVVKVDPPYTALGPPFCDLVYEGGLTEQYTVRLVHALDDAPPSYLSIVEPRTVIGPDFVVIQGIVLDDSPVPFFTLEATAFDGDTTIIPLTMLPCLDDTPDDGEWQCEWDIAAANGGAPLSDGDTVQFRVQATDDLGFTSDWTPWQTIVVDAEPPTPELDANVAAFTRTTVTENQFELVGSVSDDHLAIGIDVCDVDEECEPLIATLDPDTASQTAFAYDDVPDAPIAIDRGALCGRGEIVRTFSVNETFTVTNLTLGLNLAHGYRSDVVATLLSPSGTSATLLDDSTHILARNYDLLLTDATQETLAADREDHDTAAPYYEHERLAIDPLSVFYGEPAAGVWTLTLCDADPDVDDGAYNRSLLTLFADVAPENTRAHWNYTMLDLKESDGVTHTVTLYGVDGAANRTGDDGGSPPQFSFYVDNVAPAITVTSNLVWVDLWDYWGENHATATPVLSGTVSDGDGVAEIMIYGVTPNGATFVDEAAYEEGVWRYVLRPSTESGVYSLDVVAADLAGNKSTAGPFTLQAYPSSDLYVTTLASSDAVSVSEVLTYTLIAANDGPADNTDTVLFDVLPDEVTFNGVTAEQGTCGHAGGVVSCTLGALSTQDSAQVVISVTVGLAAGWSTFTNTAYFYGDVADYSSLNNTSIVTTTVYPGGTFRVYLPLVLRGG